MKSYRKGFVKQEKMFVSIVQIKKGAIWDISATKIFAPSVGHSATAFRNFAIRQLSIPQNDIRQRDQMAKIFRKKCLAINYSEKRHSETFIPKISIRKKI